MLHRDVWAAAAAAMSSRKADPGDDVGRLGDIRLKLPKTLYVGTVLGSMLSRTRLGKRGGRDLPGPRLRAGLPGSPRAG